MALFMIVIASLLLAASGGFVGSAFAVKKKANKRDDTYSTVPIIIPSGKDMSISPKSQSANAGDLSGDTWDNSHISAKDLKKLSKCEAAAAAEGDLTLDEERECYRLSCNDYD
jgi:hypothetical protein